MFTNSYGLELVWISFHVIISNHLISIKLSSTRFATKLRLEILL